MLTTTTTPSSTTTQPIPASINTTPTTATMLVSITYLKIATRPLFSMCAMVCLSVYVDGCYVSWCCMCACVFVMSISHQGHPTFAYHHHDFHVICIIPHSFRTTCPTTMHKLLQQHQFHFSMFNSLGFSCAVAFCLPYWFFSIHSLNIFDFCIHQS